MAKKSEDSIKTTKETGLLKCDMTEREVADAAETLARNLDELDALESEFKTVKADFKAQIEAKEAQSKVQRGLVRNKYEYRQTSCTLILNYTKQTVIVTRDDTEEIVSDRQMLAEEKQMDMGFDGDEKE